jgi:hypothetical protein
MRAGLALAATHGIASCARTIPNLGRVFARLDSRLPLVLGFQLFFEFSSGPWCDWWVVYPLASSNYVRVLAIALGIPVGVLVFGMAVAWACNGFQTKT